MGANDVDSKVFCRAILAKVSINHYHLLIFIFYLHEIKVKFFYIRHPHHISLVTEYIVDLLLSEENIGYSKFIF